MAELVTSLEGHSDRVWHVSWCSTAELLASCGGDKTIRIWTPVTRAASGSDAAAAAAPAWRCSAILEDSATRTIRAVEWSPDGHLLAAVSFDGSTHIWERDGDAFEIVATLEGHDSEVKGVAWNASGTLLATCGRDKSVWVWEVEEENEFECVAVLHGHEQDVKSVAFHPDRDLLASASYDDTIRVWEEVDDDWICVDVLKGHSSTVWGVDFCGDGSKLVSCSDDKRIIVWTAPVPGTAEGTPESHWRQYAHIAGYHEHTIYSVHWSRHDDRILVGAADNSVRLFEESASSADATASGASGDAAGPTGVFSSVACLAKAHAGDVNCARWHPTRPALFATAGDDNLVRIWQARKESDGVMTDSTTCEAGGAGGGGPSSGTDAVGDAEM